MNWLEGRQGGGYKKLRLFQFLNLDCWVLWYPKGSFIRTHNDKITGRRHYRLNVVLKTGCVDDPFRCERPLFTTKRVKLFRSDYPHSVTPVESERVVLTFGYAPKQ